MPRIAVRSFLILFFISLPTILSVSILRNDAYGQRPPTISELRQANEDRNAEIEDGSGSNSSSSEQATAPSEPATAEPEKPVTASKPGSAILTNGWWGPGGYVSPTKLGLYIFVFFIWVFCGSWMNADMERLRNPERETRNLVYLGLNAFLGGALFFVPFFWGVFPVLFLIAIVPTMVYVTQRNKELPPHEKVLTGEHIYFVFATALNRIGFKIKVKKMAYQEGPPIEMEAIAKNIDPSILKGRLILARNSPGYNAFRQAVYDALSSHAMELMFDFTPEQTTIRHQVDGVWLSLAPIPRVIEKGKTKDNMEELLEAAKILVGVNPGDRRSRQSGSFLAIVRKKTKFEAEFFSQGTKTGEAAVVRFTAKKVPFKSLEELGVRPEIQPKMLGQLNASQGIFIVSAPPANGLRSSMDVFSRVCDRFTRDIVNVEDAANPTDEIENIILASYDSTRSETPLTVLPDVVFKEPHALIVKDMMSLPTLEFCCSEVDKQRLFITMTRAKDGVEAIFQYLALKIPPQTFLSKLNGVVCQRLIRKLCPDCKEPYQPAPQLLQQLGLRPDQVKEFYRTRTPLPEPEEKKRGICETCNGVGYKGRTGLFELIEMNDSIRELILAHPNPATVRQQLVKQGQTGFLYEGVLLLLKGETTVEEFSRVMKM